MGDLEFLNHRTIEYFGKSIEKTESWALDGAIHPDDVPGVIEARKKSVEEGKAYEYEARCRRADGVYRWFQVRGGLPAHDTAGSVKSRYVLLVDIEDRKQAEQKLRRNEEFLKTAQQLSLSGCFSWCVDTNEVTFSEGARRVFGFELDTPVTLERIANLVHPDDRAVLAENIGGARGSGDEQDYGLRLLMPDGSIKYLRSSSQETRDGSGRREYVGALQDVTARHLAQEALDKARSELAHFSRATSLSTMTASIAHEVNQPLSGIITNASTCLRMLDVTPPNIEGARETAKRTIRDSNRASDVITRLRSLFSRKEVNAERVDLNEATREVIELLLSELQRNGAILQHEFADRLPIVQGDRIQLQQVILNLVRNASDAMRDIEDRPRRLLIRTEQVDENVRVTVRDSGIGFDPAIANRLFESFYTTKPEGMGIGLSVSRSIVEAHGGRMWAAANDGPGATFAFSVPCGDAT
jgi:PAS domain S-box-containing protein